MASLKPWSFKTNPTDRLEISVVCGKQRGLSIEQCCCGILRSFVAWG